MNHDRPDAAIDTAFMAALRLIGNDELQQRLRDPDQSTSVLTDLNLPDSARPRLLDLVNRLDRFRAGASEKTRISARDAEEDAQKKNEVRTTLLESYAHIRWSFWTLFGMSVVLFLVGLGLLGLAVARSLGEHSVSSSTVTIAGLAVADLVVLFYSRPWKDIARNLSSSQQTRIIATSYLASFELLQQGRREDFALLQGLTRESVALLAPRAVTSTEVRPIREGLSDK
jgi:hypothetical protein